MPEEFDPMPSTRRPPKQTPTTIGNHKLKPATLMMGYGYDPALSEGSLKAPSRSTAPTTSGSPIAWATGHIALPRMLTAGLALDVAGVPLMVAVVWMLSPMLN